MKPLFNCHILRVFNELKNMDTLHIQLIFFTLVSNKCKIAIYFFEVVLHRTRWVLSSKYL